MSKVLIHQLGQSISFGRLSLKAKVLWPMLLASSDNQGRGLAEADVIAWHVCPNVQEISLDEIPELLEEMVEQEMILLYRDSRGRLVYQVVRWWEYQRLQWARSSLYEAPEGWVDRVRTTVNGKYIAKNWDLPGGFCDVPVDCPGESPGAPPGEGSRWADKSIENKSIETKPTPPPTPPTGVDDGGGGGFSLEQWTEVYQSNIGRVRPKARERIVAWFDDPRVGFGLWDEAIGIAVANEQRKLSYIEGVLRRRIGPDGDGSGAGQQVERLMGRLPEGARGKG